MSMQERETVSLQRDCEAVVVPYGDRVLLAQGTQATITQMLGGSYTVYISGNLFRIDGVDADALGKEVTQKATLDENASDEDIEQAVWDQLRTCYDPEIPINIVDLGLVYVCRLETLPEGGHNVYVEMTLTAPGCGMGEILVQDAHDKLMQLPSIKNVQVELVFDPPWTMDKMSMEARLQTGMI